MCVLCTTACIATMRPLQIVPFKYTAYDVPIRLLKKVDIDNTVRLPSWCSIDVYNTVLICIYI